MIQPDRRSAFRRIQLREPDFWPDGQSLFPSDNSNAHWVIFLYALLELYEAMMIVFFFFFPLIVLVEYMSLPASQYSVLDAERIERVDDNTFKCYVYRFKFFAFEVCPVLLVRVDEQPNGCCIKLLSCKVSTLFRLPAWIHTQTHSWIVHVYFIVLLMILLVLD